jgi:putative endonuclease
VIPLGIVSNGSVPMNYFYIYILQCSDNSYYTGHTNELERRVHEHEFGISDTCYTFARRPLKLVFVQEFPNRPSAFLLEQKIKKWTRKKKEALISKNFDSLKVLSKKIFKNS